MDIEEHFGCQQTENIQYVWFLYTHKGISRHIYSFLPGAAELKLDVIDPIIL